jgi:hypothetical protein
MAHLLNDPLAATSDSPKGLGIALNALPPLLPPAPSKLAPSRRSTLSNNPSSVAASISYYRRSLTDSQFDKYELPSVLSSPRLSSPPPKPGRPRTPLDAPSPSRLNNRPRHRPTSSLFDTVFKPLSFAAPATDRTCAAAASRPRPAHRRNQSSADNGGTSRFTSWLRPSPTAAPTEPSVPDAAAEAERAALLALDPSTALLDAASADPLDPASFHTLHAEAAALVARLHGAFAAQAAELASVREEVAVAREEDRWMVGVESDSGFESGSECGGSPVLEAGKSAPRAGAGDGWSEVEALRARVCELEGAVDDAMGLIKAIGL